MTIIGETPPATCAKGCPVRARPSPARQFFNQPVEGGISAIERLVTDRQHETEWLDFKGGENLNDDRIKSTWSESLCGFANNQGGVLIWGIDARRDKTTDVDAASDVKPIRKVAAHQSRLLQLLPVAVDPPIIGVEIATFARSDAGDGFVVCFVPESETKPHRAEMLEGKPYMLRIGDSFRNPSPSILRSLFFPGSNPQM